MEANIRLERGLGDWLGIALRGAVMGVAEIVPGVSGGTIAFVTGIYRELVLSFAAFSFTALPWVVTNPKQFWRHHNLGFLLCLGSGMLLSIALFARLLGAAVASAPNLVWGFFFGLVLYSIFDIGRARPLFYLLAWGLPGLALGAATGLLEPIGLASSYPVFFLGGALAVCAWLLPAVSGSFLLVVLGLYTEVLQAAASLNWTILAILALGAATGLLLFAKLVRFLMGRFFEPLMGFLTGFMAGALFKLWPWQLEGALMSPGAWSSAANAPARVGATVALMMVGVVALVALRRTSAAIAGGRDENAPDNAGDPRR